MELIASLDESDSEAGPFNLTELLEDLLNGILCMLSGSSSHWTEQDASPLEVSFAIRLLRASCSQLKAAVDRWTEVFAILSTADQAMKGSVAVGGDLKRRIGVFGCVCVRALFAGELLGFAVQEIEITVRTRRAARALRNTRARVEMATAPRSWRSIR